MHRTSRPSRIIAPPAAAPGPDHGDLRAGLLAEPARIDPKYFYDTLGSCLFEVITQLPEYYPTRVERGILAACRAEIREAVGTGRVLVDLGAGNGRKAESLFADLAPAEYVAVDIASDFLADALERMRARHPAIRFRHVAADLAAELSLPADIPPGGRLLFYPGSSIGNFSPARARDLLRRIHGHCGPGGQLLIGVDLLKDRAVLEAAYADALGVTAAFNRNVLSHVNRMIGSDFDLPAWRHHAFFNATEGRVEMHLESCREQHVRWPGGRRRFAAGERIHTENSYKYDADVFRGMLEDAGFGDIRCWRDASRWFAVYLARARTGSTP